LFDIGENDSQTGHQEQNARKIPRNTSLEECKNDCQHVRHDLSFSPPFAIHVTIASGVLRTWPCLVPFSVSVASVALHL
jgi:hypothetical protein